MDENGHFVRYHQNSLIHHDLPIHFANCDRSTVLTRVNPSPNAAAQDGHPQKARVLETLPQAPGVTTLKFLGLGGTDKKNLGETSKA